MRFGFLHFWTLRLPRGVETMTLSLANALAKRGHEVTILTAKRTREPLVKPSSDVRVIEFPTFRYFETKTIVPFYALHLWRNRYDVLITYFADFGEGAAMRLAGRWLSSRHVLYLTFPIESAPHRYAAFRDWGWHLSADLVLADADYTARKASQFFGRDVLNLPSGTDPDRFRPNTEVRSAYRRRFGFEDDDLVLLNVSALETRKGTWRVIEALPQMLAQGVKVRYLVVGDGPDRSRLEHRCSELGLTEKVIFAGTTANLAPFYNAADLFVMLSDGEAGSIALLEAMASGLPVIVSDAGGFSEIVSGREGFFVNPGRLDDLSSAVRVLAESSAERTRMGTAARARVEREFSWATLAMRLEMYCSRV